MSIDLRTDAGAAARPVGRSIAALSVRTYARYAVPLTLLSVLVFAPLLVLAWRAKVPTTLPEGKSIIRLSWALLAVSFLPLLVLVGGVAPAVRGLAEDRPVSQMYALWRGVRGLVGAAVPSALAFVAVLIGGLAFVMPGLALLVLFALTGASTHEGAARLADAAAIARMQRATLVIGTTLVATLVVHGAIVWFTQRGLAVPLPAKPKPPQLAALLSLVRVAATSLAVLAPIPAVVLASVYCMTTSGNSADRPS